MTTTAGPMGGLSWRHGRPNAGRCQTSNVTTLILFDAMASPGNLHFCLEVGASLDFEIFRVDRVCYVRFGHRPACNILARNMGCCEWDTPESDHSTEIWPERGVFPLCLQPEKSNGSNSYSSPMVKVKDTKLPRMGPPRDPR